MTILSSSNYFFLNVHSSSIGIFLPASFPSFDVTCSLNQANDLQGSNRTSFETPTSDLRLSYCDSLCTQAATFKPILHGKSKSIHIMTLRKLGKITELILVLKQGA